MMSVSPCFRKRSFLVFYSCLFSYAVGFGQETPFSAKEQAKKHAIVYNKPAPGFFEGALLGNGGMGVVVTTRPDAVVLYFGHNNVWDIRIAENHREEIGTFDSVFNKVKRLSSSLSNLSDDSWYDQYNRMTSDNYSKPYPRPFPCGSVVLGFDRRKAELTGHTLDISNGLCTIKLLTADKKELYLKVFTAMEDDRLLMELTDAKGKPYPNIFNRVKVMPDPSAPAVFPKPARAEDLPAGTLSFRQILPQQEAQAGSGDRAFRLTLKVNTPLLKTSGINWNGNTEKMEPLEAALDQGHENLFIAEISLLEGLAAAVPEQVPARPEPGTKSFQLTFDRNQVIWNDYWKKSGVKLGDDFLEEQWYRNLYFFNCAVKDGVTCPGLFANWSYNTIGTAWHGDYHMNYNTQQPFWVSFSSNHLEKNLAYVGLIESLMPVSRSWAKDYYGLPGAYFPHSAYPVKMTMNPYPVPDWGWEVSETPWAVQGLWWHYLYTADATFLRDRAYEPIKAAVEFLSAYMKRPDAHGGERWKDDQYHIFPTVPPELYGLRPGLKYNYDCAVDLSLTKFIFNAFKKAALVLGTVTKEKKLLMEVDDILAHYPAYPMTKSDTYGDVFVSVPGEHDQVIYNVPDALANVFPGEDYGLHSDAATMKTLKQTYLNQQNEGGNDLVFANLQAARIGQLDIEQFKRHIRYCLLPDGTAADMVMQTRGRYNDASDFNYMAGMGIWFENFALPVVINECLMQSYNGTIRLFPNWPLEKDAKFSGLRAAGAFLVSAGLVNGQVSSVSIFSEKGQELNLVVPWAKGGWVTRNHQRTKIRTAVVQIKTVSGEWIRLEPGY